MHNEKVRHTLKNFNRYSEKIWVDLCLNKTALLSTKFT